MVASPKPTITADAPFQCRVVVTDAHHADVALVGELDLANSPLVRTELLATLALGCEHLTVDLGALRFLDSSGMGVLVVVRKRALEQDGSLQLVHVPPAVRMVLDRCGLAELFDLDPA
jgi:anti-sigma B factor antagonist